METLLKIVFTTNLALLILHEMDAIYWKEWRILLQTNNDHKGRNIFLLAHIPLLMILLFALVYSDTTFGRVVSLSTGLFLIVHYFLHRQALQQGLFSEKISFGIISAMLLGSIIQVILTATGMFISMSG
ncbi:MAG TPA: DUF6713 family protein [Anaerolineales bacterium]|nr:DUF6713 family protein [Anaerolineales bacterium]